MRAPGPALALVLGLAVLLVVLAAAGIRLDDVRGPEFHGTAYDPPTAAPDFRLTSHTGEPVALRDFRGSPVLLFFGFTRCPDFCPLTLSRLAEVLGEMGEEGAEVRVLLVTVDPENDTPEALRDYVGQFGTGIVGLMGDPEELARIRAAYGVYAERPAAPARTPAGGEHAPGHAGHGGGDPATFAHTPRVFGIDREGRLQVLIRPEEPAAVVESDVRALVRL